MKFYITLLLLGLLTWGSSGQAQSAGPCAGESSYTYHETTYNLVELGGECWFASDLQTANLNSGVAVQDATTNTYMDPSNPWSVWQRTYEYVLGYNGNYLYDYYSLTSDKLCPKGWHVPTVDDANSAAADAGFSAAFSSTDGGAFDVDYSSGMPGFWGIATSPGHEVVAFFDSFGSVAQASSHISGAATRCVKD